MLSFNTIAIALLTGVLPPLVWLWFWLNEDKRNPEPKRYIFTAFAAGCISIALVIPLQKTAQNLFTISMIITLIWASIEEISKFLAGYFGGIHTKAFDEPLDAMIYLITAALGFACVENTLFILAPLLDGDIVQTVISSNVRFIGATLVHIVASAIVGFFLGITFYRKKTIKITALFIGLLLATTLHALFNLFIMHRDGAYSAVVFVSVWVAIIVLILAFEVVKRVNKPKENKKLWHPINDHFSKNSPVR